MGLAPFEGRDVLGAKVAITRAGDGLSKALAVDPQEWHVGDTVHVVIRCEVAKVGHQPIDDTDALIRVHTLRAGTATVVGENIVGELIDAQDARLEEAQGVQRLGLDG